MRKIAIIASIWLAATATLGFSAIAFAHEHSDDGYRSGGDHHSSHCEYEHGSYDCDD